MSDASRLLVAAVGPDGTVAPGSAGAMVPWWSFGKTLLATCVLRLVEDGRVELDAPPPMPGDFLACREEGPVQAGPRHPWTVRQLLQHTGGVGDYGPLPAYHAAVAAGGPAWPDANLYRLVCPTDLVFAPGAGWRYSNVGYLLLRRLVESLLDCDLGDAVARMVLRPLGLRDCRVAVTPADLANLSLAAPTGYDPGWVFHGLVIGPVDQAALALHRLWHGDLLSPGTRAAMASATTVGGPLPGRPWMKPGYGLGVMMGTMEEAGADGTDPLEVLGHSAGGPGSSGAVYTAAVGLPATAAVFTAGTDEAPAEFAALRAIRRLQSTGQLAT